MNDVVSVRDVRVEFPVHGTALARVLSRSPSYVHAVDGVSMSIAGGEVFGLVGESGSGKTTLGRVMVKLLKPTAGRIYFEGREITKLTEGQMRPFRQRMQIIFQDPHASLNPAMTIGAAIGHPLIIHGLARSQKEAHPQVMEIMGEVGLNPPEGLYDKLPSELSGGQKQRVVIARAMILKPSFIVADEPVAMLDMSVRARILELLLELKRRHNLTLLFITHDLATAKFLCDRIAIMYLGRIVEEGPAAKVYEDPKHPYTQALLRAIPIPDPARRSSKELPKGEVPDAIHPPANCRFHPRCPVAVQRCGWEPRDLLGYLDDRRTRLAGDALARDLKLLGDFHGVAIKGQVMELPASDGSAQELHEYLQGIVSTGGSSLFQAIEGIQMEEDAVVVRFKPWEELREVSLDDRRVLCVLYQ